MASIYLFFDVSSSLVELFLCMDVSRIALYLTRRSQKILARIPEVFNTFLYMRTHLKNIIVRLTPVRSVSLRSVKEKF